MGNIGSKKFKELSLDKLKKYFGYFMFCKFMVGDEHTYDGITVGFLNREELLNGFRDYLKIIKNVDDVDENIYQVNNAISYILQVDVNFRSREIKYLNKDRLDIVIKCYRDYVIAHKSNMETLLCKSVDDALIDMLMESAKQKVGRMRASYIHLLLRYIYDNENIYNDMINTIENENNARQINIHNEYENL